MAGERARIRAEPLVRLPRIGSFLCLTLLGFTGFAATLAALPAWATQNGASTASAGLVSTVMLGATVATQPLVPALMARFPAGHVLALGLVLLGAPSVLFLLSGDLLALLVVNAVRGAGFGILTVVGSALTAVLAPPGRHGETAGLYGLAIAVPNLVIVPGAVWLTQNVGFEPVVVLAAMPLLAVPLSLRIRTRPAVPDAGAVATGAVATGALAGRGSVVLATLPPAAVLTVVTLAGGGLLAYLPIERPTGFVATAGLLLLGLTAALTRWQAGVLADRIGTRLLLPASVLAGAAGMAGIAGGLLLGHDVLLLAGAALFGVGYGAVQNLTLVIAFARAGRGGITTASAVWNAGFDAGTGLGPLVVGGLALAGLAVPAALAVLALLVAVAVPVTLAMGQPSTISRRSRTSRRSRIGWPP